MRRLTDTQEAEVARRYRDGAFTGELAAEFAVGRKTILNALRRQGCPTRSKREAQAHLNRRRRQSGERHPNFKSGRSVTADGYVLVAIDETDPLFVMAKDRGRTSIFRHGYVLEHRLVMARSLGRPLASHETVHHKNGRRDDNRLANLQLRNGRHGKGHAFRCCDCGSHNVIAEALS